MMQETLDFDRPPVPPSVDTPGWTHRNADSTEVAGAQAAKRGSGFKRMQILRVLFEAGASGLTDFQIEQRTGIRTPSVTSLRNLLKRDGLVEDAPFTRPGRVGSPVRVRRLTDHGQRVYRRSA